ncbi:MAG TPA: hypothetical protein VGF75_05610 [Candidatus Saccharimonadales bacterium]|jgi:hypothetical protein
MTKGIDFTCEPFLLQEQEAILGLMSSVANEDPVKLHLASDSDNEDLIARICDPGLEALDYREGADQSRVITNIDEMADHLRCMSLSHLGMDSSLKYAIGVTAVMTGLCIGEGDDMQAVHGYDFGQALIKTRASSAATTWVVAYRMIGTDLPGEEYGLWQLTADTYTRTGQKPPIILSDQEIQAIEKLRVDLYSRFPTNTELPVELGDNTPEDRSRLKQHFEDQGEEIAASDTPIEQFRAKHEWLLGQLPVLSATEIEIGFRTPTRLRKYLQRAAELEPALARDPRVRFIAFLGCKGRLATAPTVRADTLEFNKIVERARKIKPVEDSEPGVEQGQHSEVID